VGFDDLHIASHVHPNLTSIAYNYSSMAETTIELLMDKINNHICDESVHLINPWLITRESSLLNSKYDVPK